MISTKFYMLKNFPRKQLTFRNTCGIVNITCEKGFCFYARFRFSSIKIRRLHGREAVGIPGGAGNDTNNKEVPLDAR